MRFSQRGMGSAHPVAGPSKGHPSNRLRKGCGFKTVEEDFKFFPLIIILAVSGFILFSPLPSATSAAEITLAWDASTDPSITGYKLYYGPSSRNYNASIDVGNQKTWTISGLKSGSTYYFAATGYNSSGVESGYSNEVVHKPSTQTRSPTVNDFDGDGTTDVAVYNMANGWWSFNYSRGGYGFDAIGGPNWRPVPGDYDGDRKTDVAVYDATNGFWLFHFSSGAWKYDHIGIGGSGYTPVPGDYDGDGITEMAVYQKSTGNWFFKYSSGGYEYFNLGGPGKIPVAADYDGDGKTDIAVYETATGYWYFHYSNSSTYGFDAIGVGGSSRWTPVAGDYDGDGKADIAVYDTKYGWWLFHMSSGGWEYDHIGKGGTGYTPVPGDYDGDGTTDLAVYNSSDGSWFFKYSSGTYGYDSLGGSGWVPGR